MSSVELIEFLRSMLDYGDTGEDAVAIKWEIEQVLHEVNNE